MVTIAAAAASDDLVYDDGELLFATLLVGSSVGHLNYQEPPASITSPSCPETVTTPS